MLWMELPTNTKMFNKVLFILFNGFSITAAAPRQAVDNVLPACDPVCCDRYYIYDRVKGYCTFDLDLLRGDKVYDGNKNNDDEVETLKSFGHVADIATQDEMAKTSEAGSKNVSACDPVCCRTRYYSYNKVKGYCTLDWKLLMEGDDEDKKQRAEEIQRNFDIVRDLAQETMWRALRAETQKIVFAAIITVVLVILFACIYYCKTKARKSKRKASEDPSVPPIEEVPMAQVCNGIAGQAAVHAV